MAGDFTRFVPTYSEFVSEGLTFKKEYSKENYEKDFKAANDLMNAAYAAMNNKIKEFQKGTLTIEQMVDPVKAYVEALSNVKYLSIMNGIDSQSSNPQTQTQVQGMEPKSENGEEENAVG
jgi:hypothetical protein